MSSKPFSFLHCADLHLDARLGDSVRQSCFSDINRQEEVLLRDAPLLALDNVKEVAIANNVDCVVIAGDLFDSKESASKDQRVRSRLTNFFKALSDNQIEVFVAVGNHDPIKSIKKLAKSWPTNVHLFSSVKPETFHLDRGENQISIHGVSYANVEELRDLCSAFPPRENGAINIGVLHTNVGGDTSVHKNYAPSTIDSLAKCNYEYFALGHVHKREVLNQHPHIAYSGNTQGLSAKGSEQEPKGCVIVQIDGENTTVSSRFISTDVVRYISCDLDASDFLETDDAVAFVVDEISKACEDPNIFYLVRVKVSLFANTNADSFRDAINDSRTNFFVTSLKEKNLAKTFETLANDDPFFETIQFQLQKSAEPSLEDLYDKRSTIIERLLDGEVTNEPIKEQASQVILTVASEIENEMSQS